MVMMGEVNEDELFDAFKEQAEALAEGGADALVVETMTELAEAVAAVQAAKTTGLLRRGRMTYDSRQKPDLHHDGRDAPTRRRPH